MRGLESDALQEIFHESTRDRMLGQLLALKTSGKTVAQYEVEFNCLVKFTPEGIRDSKRTKIQSLGIV